MPFPGVSGSLFYHTMLVPYWAAFGLWYRTRVSGKANLPMSGPALILANHQSYLDPMLLGIAAYPRKLTFLARKELFSHKLFGPFIRWCGAVPIDQGFGRDGIRAIRDRLEMGEAVVVFPEGERTPNGDVLPLKPGISLLLKDADWPIIPTGIAGAFEAWPRTATLSRRGHLSVHFGEALQDYKERPRAELLGQLQFNVSQAYRLAATRAGLGGGGGGPPPPPPPPPPHPRRVAAKR